MCRPPTGSRGQRIAAERAEADGALLDLVFRPQRHAFVIDHDQHAVARDHGTLRRQIKRDDRNIFLQDILPDIQLGPAGEREDADLFALVDAGIVGLPHFRPLRFRVPGVFLVSEGKDALLGARFLLVAARAPEGRVETIFVERLPERHRLHDMGVVAGAMREGPTSSAMPSGLT